MIDFSYQKEFQLKHEQDHVRWLNKVADFHDATVDVLGYVFCDDEYVHSINLQHLNHDTYTDIITFDYGTDTVLEGEIYISVDRVEDNANDLEEDFDTELRRVMCHGLLHMIGYDDDTVEKKAKMRALENEALQMFHVKQ
ncbi:rRNA maturation factor [Nonlabens sp. YIK11]|uniref:rRNA maturation RNase YbeY n=1 Tax=Nonlabens sp. YIK11 TaxID=1453349 RepID=UPI0006DC8C45|nr:rRNA maturation RNase YbeY [Nonlabens sp. YIK11]KQC32372.1 rRNA maturation factor [Nonlabens sp. YIK11]